MNDHRHPATATGSGRTTRSSSAAASPAARPRSCSAAPACASPWSRSSPTRRPSSESARTSSRPRACRPLERLGLLEPIVAAGGQRSRIQRVDPVGLDRSAARARPAAGVNLRREVLDPLVREAAAETPGVELHAGLDARAACCATAARSAASRSATATARRASCGPARRRRRRARLADRRAGRRAGEDLPHERFAYGGYFEGALPDVRARQRDLVPRPALGGRLPDRQRPHLLRGDADQGAGCPNSSATRSAALVSFLADAARARRRSARRAWSNR